MDLNNLSPYIRVAMDSIIHPPWIFHERVIFDYELLFVKEGEILVTVEDESFNGRQGDIFLFKPKQRHSIKILGNSRLRQPHIHFDLFYQADSPDVKVSFKPLDSMNKNELSMFREDITQNTGIKLPNKIKLKNTKYFEEILFDIIKEFEMKLPYYEISAKGLFIKLWTYLIRENYWDSNAPVFSNIEVLTKIKEYLQYNFNREVALTELESEFNISRYHLVRLFKKAFGIAPIHYQQLIRIEKAKEMIQFTDRSFTQVAETFGFSSVNSFSRAFRNTEGVAPSYYRKKIRNS